MICVTHGFADAENVPCPDCVIYDLVEMVGHMRRTFNAERARAERAEAEVVKLREALARMTTLTRLPVDEEAEARFEGLLAQNRSCKP